MPGVADDTYQRHLDLRSRSEITINFIGWVSVGGGPKSSATHFLACGDSRASGQLSILVGNELLLLFLQTASRHLVTPEVVATTLVGGVMHSKHRGACQASLTAPTNVISTFASNEIHESGLGAQWGSKIECRPISRLWRFTRVWPDILRYQYWWSMNCYFCFYRLRHGTS